MKRHTRKRIIGKKMCITACLWITAFLLASCASMDPAKVNIEISKTRPVPKITSYTEALMDLGLMSEIYETQILRIQSIPISDNTGSSFPTGGEIPKDISEMVKSALNSIGGNLIYIPYDPSFIQNQMVTGYSNFQNKLIPDIVVSGGITEFDRGLETREKNTDASARLTYEGLPDYLPGLEDEVPYPSKEINFRFGSAGKTGLARITLDFNLLNFQTMAGIPRMSTVNSIEVQKAASGKELGVSIFAQAFGRKGKIKKVQGRHAAIRLLVELSMIQIIGRQLILPYWKLLGDDALPDRVVLESASTFYQSLDQSQKIAFTQQQLFLHGYNIPIDGGLDENTTSALRDFFQTDTPPEATDFDRFIQIWSSIPVTKETMKRRQLLNATLQEIQDKQAALEQQQRQQEQEEKQAAPEQAQDHQADPVPHPEQAALEANQQEVETISEETPDQELIDQETVDQLLRILEQKKRKIQESKTITNEKIEHLLRLLEEKK